MPRASTAVPPSGDPHALALNCGLKVFALITVMAAGTLASAGAPREIPSTRPDHPGNVYFASESVAARVPQEVLGKFVSWVAEDVDGTRVADGGSGGTCVLGDLPVGWYRISFRDGGQAEIGWTTAAVLSQPEAPVAMDSPVCVDSATSWFARDNEQRRRTFAHLASLAGINWIRDRLSWDAIETARGTYSPTTTLYDASATALAETGMNVLQVFHGTPQWAVDRRLDGDRSVGRFPRDLRDMHRFMGAAASRFKGRIRAWEPWNEANIEPFGGHTIDEMCALQKAAFLGAKKADPGVTVCWNVYAGSGSPIHTEGVLRNETWPYFDTYNIHSYSPPERYLPGFATAREAACGKPIWLTECGIRLNAASDKPAGELKAEDAVRQAEFLTKSFASSLFAGVSRHFFFILGNYLERGIQFGVLRHDQTPRPGYVALAAVGRFLAGAECLGRVKGEKGREMILFRARPDGKARCVAIAWAPEAMPPGLPANVRAEGFFDCFGRTAKPRIGPRPAFILLPLDDAKKFSTEEPARVSAARPGTASQIVIQPEFPHDATVLQHQGHRVALGRTVTIPLWLYNFGERQASGGLTASAPEAWRVTLAQDNVVLEPGARSHVELVAELPATGRAGLHGDWVTVRGLFEEAGQPVCAFRLCGDARDLVPVSTRPIPSSTNALAWAKNVAAGARLSAERQANGGVLFTVEFGDSDPWAYPFLKLGEVEIPADSFDGLQVTLQLLEGEGTLRAQFVEDSGASYIAGFNAARDSRQPQRLTALFKDAIWATHSKKDPSGKLEPGKIRRLMIGINAERDSKVRLLIRNPHWVRF